MRKSLWITPAVLFVAIGSPNARADTVYTYAGNAYTFCLGTYTCTGTTPALSLTFATTLMGAQLDNLSNHPISASTFSFTDGTGLYITQANAVSDNIFISTGPTGAITGWFIVGLTTEPPPLTLFRINSWFNTPEAQGATVDNSFVGPNPPIIGIGEVLDDPGVWSSSSSPIPEPSSSLLFGTGLLGLLALAARSKRHAPRTPC
jgi:hypothetical protein